MKTFHHVRSLQAELATARSRGKRIGLVPTMGNLHAAHIALVNIAQAHCDVVVTSIFVNRLQFGLNEDWDCYPRTFEQDCQKLQDANCDMVFHPEEVEIYPNGMDQQTRVVVPSMADVLCGASRPGHFEGVTTVVSKLFNIVQPELAVFGVKDYQQLAIIRRMVEDLHLPVRVISGEVVREEDGLAMSSRNSFITPEERPRACELYRALGWVREEIVQGNTDFTALQGAAKARIREAGFRPDYVSICNSTTLQLAAVDDRQITVLGAMYTGAARLIDNLSLQR
ncbi:MAG: pantoate--beta-alanine ligase [Cellvibrionaceae bacterium]|nr:pantoate--beta-alanine ligase [Cellvibrionaceae bacterium]